MSSFSNAIEAGRAFLKVVIDDADVAKGFERLQNKLNILGQKMQKWGAISTAVSGAIIGTIGAAAKSFASAGAAIDDMTKRTGFSAKTLGELSYAAEQSGANLAGLEKAVKGMEKFMLGASRGGAGFTATLAEIGVKLADIEGQSPERQFQVLSEAIAGVDDETRRGALAMKVFGKSGADLLPMFIEGADGIAALREEAQRLGLVMTEEDVEAAAKLDDAIARLSAQATMAFNQIGAAVAGPLTEFGDKLSDLIASAIEFIKENPNLVSAIAAISAAAGVASVALVGVGTALTFIAAHPVITALAGITVAIVSLNEALKGFGEWLADTPEAQRLKEDLKEARDILKEMEEAEARMAAAKNAPNPQPFKNDDGETVGGPNGKFSNGVGWGNNTDPNKDLITLGPLSSGGPEGGGGGFGNLLLGDAMRAAGLPGDNGAAKLKKRLSGWASAAANAANVLNPLAGVDVGGIAGDAKRFGKKALAGKVDWKELGDDAMKGVGDGWKSFNELLFGKTDVASTGTFNANAVASLQGGNLDQQMLNVLQRQLGIQERMERKGDGWGAT